VVLAHTRWASVGIVSEANAHPHNAEEYHDRSGPYVAAALNGDIDNHVELRSTASLQFPAEITSDSKVAPTLISRLLAGGTDAGEAFRATVDRFEGSVAIAAHVACEPGNLFLAVRGSGQGLHVGLAEDAFVVASEPYGLVEQTSRYVRIDGEATSASGATGQVLILDRSEAGSLGGIRRMSYDGTDLPLSEVDVRGAEITTRDIDLGGFRHYLLKEISESPRSLATTLRGRIVERDGLLSVELGDDVLPPDLRSRLASGAIVSIAVIGQGTAAVAGQAMAASLAKLLASSAVSAVAVSAAELSGFALTDDMSDTLVVAISQSGTTTDTNRTVDLARARGAAVIGIVNRRGSDLAERCHGVLYTSDGRDVEMSVASTKAFYAQVAAGALLALGLARETGDGIIGRSRRGEGTGAAGAAAGAAEEHELLTGLLALPAAMERLLSRRQEVALAAQHAPGRRHWAVVGSGLDRIAAQEVRIKLSELCYQSISCDAIEDKKHIDLSSEPLIFVCAAGLLGANADDVSKETAIYRAHKAMPIVVATEGQRQFDGAVHTIEVPSVHPDLAFVLSAMAGHLFAYEAALAIDAQARVLREARGAVEEAISGNGDLGAGDQLLERLGPVISPPAERFLTSVASGALDGCLDAGLALRLASLLRCAAGIVPLEIYESERGRAATPGVLIDDLTAALTDGIEMLSRPIDAIKHQAKTVTVGISRSEERLFQGTLVSQVLAAGVARGALGYRSLRTLAALDPAVVEVNGYTRYHIDGGVGDGPATIGVVDKGGVAATLASRTATDPTLRGTKNRAVSEREVTVARGARDGRTVVLVPETKGNHVQGLTLLHVTFADRLAPDVARAVLSGYRNRYGALVDAVSETESRFDDERLSRVATIELLVEPVAILASHWRG